MLQAIGKVLRDKRGQSLVELALVMPMVLLLLMGVVEFGRMFHTYLVITQGSREGARLAVVGESDAAIVERVREVTASLDQTMLTVDIQPGEDDRVRGVAVKVIVNFKLKLIVPDVMDVIPDPLTISASTVMRME